ncbi:MAG: hypothetical protein ACKVP7_24360 [Hyphomicrobiaceae bacterium]
MGRAYGLLRICLVLALGFDVLAGCAKAATGSIQSLTGERQGFANGKCIIRLNVLDSVLGTDNDRPASLLTDDRTAVRFSGQQHTAVVVRPVGIVTSYAWPMMIFDIAASQISDSTKVELLDIDEQDRVRSVLDTKFIRHDQICPRASATISVTPSKSSFTSETQEINYTYILRNTSPYELYFAADADDVKQKTGPITCIGRSNTPFIPPLAPGGQTTCTSSYTVGVGDLGNNLNYRATIYVTPSFRFPPLRASDPNGWFVGATASGTIAFVAQPSWTLVAVPSATTYSTVGQSIGYSFSLKNTGNVAINTIGLTGIKTGAIQCLASSLAPTAITTCASTYVTEAADIGTEIAFAATATGSPATGTLAPISTSGRLTYQSRPTLALTVVTCLSP